MNTHGGQADEPTSYGLQSPAGPPAHTPAPSGHGIAYEPTQRAVRRPPAVDGSHSPAPGGPGSPAHGGQDAPGPGGTGPGSTGSAAGGPGAGSGAGPGVPPRGDGSADHGAGRLVGGRYQLLSRLGHGGMGTVWRARDVVMGREVAVKEPRVPDTLPEYERQTAYQRMLREARAAARIDHPSVVTVHDVAEEDGRPWIVMELVRGRSLADQLTEGTSDPREAARIGLAVLGALSAAHEAGVLHRDVKPDNVLLGRHDRVVLTDFGIAQVEGEQRLTETGAFVGSPEFIAPERVLGQQPGPESDLWSLGVVLYAAVEGVSPYRRSHTPATLQAVLSAEPPAPARGTGALGTLIMQLLRKEPAARPSAPEIRQVLESVVRPPQPPAGLPGLAGARGGASGGRAFVPPVLQGNRKAQLGLTAGVVAVAAAVFLAFANPFAGDEMPDGWVVREEGEVVGASLAVPRDYRRTVDADGQYVQFADPSGVFSIELGVDSEEISEAGAEAKELVDYFAEGGYNNIEMTEARTTTRKVTQGSEPAVQLDTTYMPYNYNKDDIAYRKRTHLYVDEEKEHSWTLTVTMPARGDARADGDRLFRDVVRYLNVRGL